MRFIKTMVVCSIFATGLLATGCKKNDVLSRDRSSIVPPKDVPVVVPPDPTLVVFDNVDVADGWETVGTPTIDATSPKEGKGYLKNTITNGSDFMQFIKHANPPIDSKLTTANGQFSFWWYISDVSQLKADGQIEITSGGDADKEEYGWSITKLIPTLTNGWNQLTLNFKDADLVGVPNPSRLNFFRVFFWTKTKDHPDLVTGVDGLVFKANPNPGAPVAAGVFDNCDSKDGWDQAGEGSIDNADKKEGTGSFKASIGGGNALRMQKKLTTPVNTNVDKATGGVQFWFYVQDVSKLKTSDGQIEITSSGQGDSKEFAWNTSTLTNLKTGWNQLTLAFRDAQVSGDGEPDLTAVNWFRIYLNTTADVGGGDHYVVGLDDIKFVTVPPPAAISISFDNCDSIDGWDQAGERSLNTTDKKEGTGSLRFFIGGGDALRMQRPLSTPINTGLTQANGQLTFWLWIEDASNIKLDDGQVELTSSGQGDSKEYAWPTTAITGLKNGWNQVKLNFSDAQLSGDGGPDLSAINWFRMYFNTKAPVASGNRVTFGVDDVRVGSK